MNAVGSRRLGGLGLAGLVFLLDQAVKWWLGTQVHLADLGPIRITGFFDLRYAQNFGVSFSLLEANSVEMRWILVLMTLGIAAGVAWWMLHETAKAEILALGLVLGGALGNIHDRAMWGFVVDYADFHLGDVRPFAIFNLADAAISLGVVIILARSFLSREKRGDEPGGQTA
jgi:signal peptidase II